MSEAPDPMLDLVTFYSQNLGRAAAARCRRSAVLRGKEAFYESGCVGCHTPKFVTSREAPNPAHKFQLIWPYSDLLLHDMGEGLADHRPEGDADGYEWRTPPLWGIGLTETVSAITPSSSTMAGRGTSPKPSSGTAARRRRRATPSPQFRPIERDDLIAFLESL